MSQAFKWNTYFCLPEPLQALPHPRAGASVKTGWPGGACASSTSTPRSKYSNSLSIIVVVIVDADVAVADVADMEPVAMAEVAVGL